MVKTDRLNQRIAPAVRARLKQMATDAGKTETAILEELIMAGGGGKEPVLLMMERQIIGAVRRHLEGSGLVIEELMVQMLVERFRSPQINKVVDFESRAFGGKVIE